MNELREGRRWVLAGLCLLGTLVMVSSGCRGKRETLKWQYLVRNVDGNATLTTEKFTLIMEGVSADPTFGGSLLVSGTLESKGRVPPAPGTDGLVWSYSYEGKGVCRMVFGLAHLKITNHGETLVVGKQCFPLDEEMITLRFNPDGELLKSE